MNLPDKDLINVVLSEHKVQAGLLTHLVEESANQNLRDDASNILNKTFCQQKEIFDLMMQKGWYKLENASSQDMMKAQQELSQA